LYLMKANEIVYKKRNEHFFTLTANSVLCEKMFIFKN